MFALNIASVGEWEKRDKGHGSRKIKFWKRNSHIKTEFPLLISSVNVTKSADSWNPQKSSVENFIFYAV